VTKPLTKQELAEEIAILKLEVRKLSDTVDILRDYQNKILSGLSFYTACALAGVSPDEPQKARGVQDTILIAITGEMPF
jgi:hypothetical protein